MQTNHDTRQFARTAGLLYLIIIACGIGSEVFIRGSLYDDVGIRMTACSSRDLI